jgi:hypothetical protein
VQLLCSLCTLFTLALCAPAGADVLVLGDGGGVSRRHDPGVAAFGDRGPGTHRQVGAPLATAAKKPRRTVIRELKRMLAAGAIDQAEYEERRAQYESARELVPRLPGRRRIEMAGAVGMLERFAARGSLTVSRLQPLWLSLQRNRKWWTTGPLLAPGRRVSFDGSEVVWQYVAGQGLQFHPLANFGKLNALWSGKDYDDRLELLLDELLGLAVERAGGIGWEYAFDYGGGSAPWVSGLAQGTALQALARAAIRLQRKDEILPIAQQGLALFEAAPPAGVRVPEGDGAHYLIYSFNPHLRVLNGFVQSLVGLSDFAAYANDDRARTLFADGDREAQREVPAYDTGFWSRYSQARESNLSYHRLLMGFLGSLCERTSVPVYCTTRDNFDRYLYEPPKVEVVTQRLRGGRTGTIRFRLSKISTVTVRVARSGRLVRRAALLAGAGGRSVGWAVPRRKGIYEVRVTAVDLAGNPGTAKAEVEVLKPRKRRAKGA